jgi:hypothetical protein
MHIPHPSHTGVYEHLLDVPNTPRRSSILGGALYHQIVHRMSTGRMFTVQKCWSQQVLTYLDCVERAVVQNPWVSEEKAVGYPLAPDLEMRHCLGMWP